MSIWLVPLMTPLTLAGPLLQDGPADDSSVQLAFERAGLARVIELHEAGETEDQRRAYAGLQPTPLSSFVELLALERVPADWLDGEETDRPLTAHTLAALHGALTGLRLPDLRAYFETLAAEETDLARRAVCVAVLADVGERRDLKLVLALATPLDSETRVLARRLRKAYENALFRLLERDPGGLPFLRRTFDDMHEGLLSATVDAVAGRPSHETLGVLLGMLGRSADLDAYLLAAAARVGAEIQHPVSEADLTRVRNLLTHADRRVVQAAVRACGRLEDYEAIPQLLEMLSGPDANLVTSAHLALRDITEVPFRADSRMWRTWYERETAWWELRSADAFGDLDSRDETRVSDAINQITRQRLHRHELAEALLPVLQRPESELVVMACQGLNQIGSDVALPQLVSVLEHRDWGVRRAAWTALVRISGHDRPPEVEAWQALLESREP